ncbi:LYR motif-containing protein 4 [Galdieria sulphuraria]|uniref:Complex 1 LYR protein domain-containing protein n=1 Tax=Galdieria sulphuraria TaxID=130081 RepID=M2XVU3_GALSU|nr:uncharacterized protein Gasu_47540 [Galdieria sulphuraria]EME27768.1 hypothetical protein Gasu_47540 [Galdieria sulphuraria]GJD10183.1 LYR motif-containing protein 4 [Galdieria sulphuraria]|eukprot:XP_005704288.1 hypothetical protein Gasu_47540 [Galdieria sulphuraria]
MSRSEVLRLYRKMLKYSSMFSDYNFREYSLARVKESFRQNKLLQDEEAILKAVEKAQKNLQMLQRQAQISQMFKGERLVIEAETPSRNK